MRSGGLDVEGSGPNGPLAVPGKYAVEVNVGGHLLTTTLEVVKERGWILLKPKKEFVLEADWDEETYGKFDADKVTEE